MELTIKITNFEKINRRRLNNLLANCEAEIHHFILNSTEESITQYPKMGVEEYMLEVSISDDVV